MIEFSPAWSTLIRASPVLACSVTRTAVTSTPAPPSAARQESPKSSAPQQPTIRTDAPSRAAASAWFAPLPPGCSRASAPSTVSPGPASRGTLTDISIFRLPSTVTRGIGSPSSLLLP